MIFLSVKRLLIGVILLSVGGVSAQSVQVFYELSYRPNTQSEQVIRETMLLHHQMDTHQSWFRTHQIKDFDDFNVFIHKDFSNEIFWQYQPIVYKIYKTTYSQEFQWNIDNEHQNILGYKATKATTTFGGRSWTAWFTQELPLSDGPYKFRGLPGLILEIISDDGDYKFSFKGLEKIEKDIQLPPNATLLKPSDLQKLKQNTMKNPSAQYSSSKQGGGYSVSVSFNGKQSTEKEIIESFEKEYMEWMKLHNNPIEKNDIWLK